MEAETGFSFHDHDDAAEIDEMMVIEINFGKGKSGDVVVHYGDNPALLAQDFVKTHGLKNSVLPIVEDHIRTTMEDFVASTAEMRPQTPPLEADEGAKPSQPDTPFLHHPATELPPSPPQTLGLSVSFGESPIRPIPVCAQDKAPSPGKTPDCAPAKPPKPASPRSPVGNKVAGKAPKSAKKGKPEWETNLDRPAMSSNSSCSSRSTSSVTGGTTNNRSSTTSLNSQQTDSGSKDKTRRSSSPRSSSANGVAKAEDREDRAREASLEAEAKRAKLENMSTVYNTLKQRGVHPSNPHLQPASKTLALNRSMGLHTSLGQLQHSHSHAAEASSSSSDAIRLSERLHRAAGAQQKKLDKVRKANDETEIKGLRDNMFRLSKASRDLMDNNRPVNGHKEVTLRLYDEGMRDAEKKKKVADEKGGPTALDTWSCAKCGSFHSLPMRSSTNPHAPLTARVCPVCSWSSAADPTFRPTLIGLELAGTLPYQPTVEDLLRRRTEAKSIFEQLSSAGMYNTSRNAGNLWRIKEGWKKRDLSMPFQPTIPAESTKILAESMRKAEEEAASRGLTAISMAEILVGSSVSTGQYLLQNATERLSRQLKPTPRRAVTLPASPKPAPRPSKEVEAFVTRLAFEYQDREARRAVRADRLYSVDPATLKPLWKPSIGPPPPSGGVSSSVHVQKPDGSTQKRDIVDVLYAKEKRRQERLVTLVKEKERRDIEATGPEVKVHALEESDKILQAAMDRSIEEMFRLLYVATTGHGISPSKKITAAAGTASMSTEEDLQRAQSISNASEALKKESDDWEGLELDLGLVQPDMMIPEVTALLKQVVRDARADKQKKAVDCVTDPVAVGNGGIVSLTGRSSSSASARIDKLVGSLGSKGGRLAPTGGEASEVLPTSYDAFYELVRRALSARDGIGRFYLYAPRKKPEVAMQMIRENEKNITFQPKINGRSQVIAKANRAGQRCAGESYQAHADKVLACEANRAAMRLDAARKKKEECEVSQSPQSRDFH